MNLQTREQYLHFVLHGTIFCFASFSVFRSFQSAARRTVSKLIDREIATLTKFMAAVKCKR